MNLLLHTECYDNYALHWVLTSGDMQFDNVKSHFGTFFKLFFL